MLFCFKPKNKSIKCVRSAVEVRERDVLEYDPDIVERDPSGRYVRSNEILGKGEFKTVYKAFDQFDGIEVAWNQIRIDDKNLVHSPEDIAGLYSEVSLLKSLKHENVVKCYCSWVNKDLNNAMSVNMITELFTSGDLRQYRRKHKNIDLKAIKNWARQILKGLQYLHTHDPPIIHRDLQGDNIFINGNTGRVKIGDLGLAVVLRDQPASDCNFIGKPEFLAPELYRGEDYDQLVDIYTFGMCILEMATCEYPYSECKTRAEISAQVTSGLKPASLSKVADPGLKRFIEKCLVPASMRPSAAELLNDWFLGPTMTPSATQISQPMDTDADGKVNSDSTAFCGSSNIEAMTPITLSVSKSRNSLSFTLLGKKDCDFEVSMTLRITGLPGDAYKIDFVFDLQKDTSTSIAEEMVEALCLTSEDAIVLSGLMDELMARLEAKPCESHSSLPQQMKDDSDLDIQEWLSSDGSEMELCKGSSSGTMDDLSHLSSISCVALDDSYNQCNELRMELDAIDAEFEQRKTELMKTREDAIENAKRKWASAKSSVT